MTVTRTLPASTDIYVSIRTVAGTATAGVDYVGVLDGDKKLFFDDGVTEAAFMVSNVKCHLLTIVTIFMRQFENRCQNIMH